MMAVTDGESDASSMPSVPGSIAGFGSVHSLVSAVTLEDETSSVGEGSLGGFLPHTPSRDWRFGSKTNLTSVKSKNSLGRFVTNRSSSNLHGSSRFYPDHSPKPMVGTSNTNLKGRLSSSKMPSALPLRIPQRKVSSNQMGLNIPTRKASLYNLTSGSNSSSHNATFENVSTTAKTNAKFDMIIDRLSSGTKSSLFPQVHKTSGLNLSQQTTSTSLSTSAPPALGLANDIFVVLSPETHVSRPKISQSNLNGVKGILGMAPKKHAPLDHRSIPSVPPSLPQRKPSGPEL